MASPRMARSVASVVAVAALALPLSAAQAIAPKPGPSPSASASPSSSPSPTPTTQPDALARITERVRDAMSGSTAAHADYQIEISGIGTISHDADRRSAPASNEKVLTTMTLLNLVGPSFRYVTTVSGTSAVDAGVLNGDLVLVGSGDPTLTKRDLGGLAKRLANNGLRRVTGRLIVDDSRYSHATFAPGWKADFIPGESPTVDAFTVNNNNWRSGAKFIPDPTPANAGLWRDALHNNGITVAGPTVVAPRPAVLLPLASHSSDPLSAIVKATLQESINFYAEMMLREAGVQRNGQGSRPGGVAAVRAMASSLHIPLGTVEDGSGLSYANRESPSTFVSLFEVLPTQTSAYASVYAGLPVSCRPAGTLKYRMCGELVSGRVRAKTGTLDYVSSLSGYALTASNRLITFSFLLSGIRNSYVANAHIDAALGAVVRSTA